MNLLPFSKRIKINDDDSFIANGSITNDNDACYNLNTTDLIEITKENEKKKEELMMVPDLSEEVKQEDAVELEERSVVVVKNFCTAQELKKCQDTICRAIKEENLLALTKKLETITIEQTVELLKIQDKHGSTALYWALVYRNKKAINLFFVGLSQEQRVELLKIQDVCGKTALHWAVEANNNEAIGLLLEGLSQEQRVDLLKIQDKHGSTALLKGINNKEAVVLLLEGLSGERKVELLKMQNEHGWMALHWTQYNSNNKLIEPLLEGLSEKQRVELLKIRDNNGRTVLCWAVRENNKKAIRLLLKGLSVEQRVKLLNIQDTNKWIDLYLVVMKKQPSISLDIITKRV